eukprot:CAMPEP_0172661186 /NCGR_PEP_ID=MMETSP1074-20121228/4530_1 /TAXON_ID=2916 /ORGANISM="Ceratium fusus, Strain PA161109" /LENGTH=127 /DNA_ID=CAMNT_0013476915 /DNA_START=232 /DNA_END=615 /DNA_ORIENTATION=-
MEVVINGALEPDGALGLLPVKDQSLQCPACSCEALVVVGNKSNTAHETTKPQSASLSEVDVECHGAALGCATQEDAMALPMKTCHLCKGEAADAPPCGLQRLNVSNSITSAALIPMPRPKPLSPGLI